MSSDKTEIDELLSAGERELGHYLVVERQAQKLTQEQVAEQLHLDVKIIRALESNDFESLPSVTFTSGYIRNYAKLLKIPPEPLISAYQSRNFQLPELKVTQAESVSGGVSIEPIKRILGIALIFLVIVLVIWLAKDNLPEALEAEIQDRTTLPLNFELPGMRGESADQASE